jgi:glycosyltransferase involved in cell wall biosynthesis
MRIGINLLCLLPGINGGVETYAISTLRELVRRDSRNEYVVFVSRQGAELNVPDAPNVIPVVLDVDARARPIRYAWEQFALPAQARRFRLDLLHSPGYQGPLRCPCPTVVTLPDLNYIEFGYAMPTHRRMALRFFCSRAAQRAERVITISHFSKQQIIKHLRLPESKISMIHLGPGIIPGRGDWSVVRIKHRIFADYAVAFSGGNYPHKNMSRLMEAFARIRTPEPVSLAVIGDLSPELRALSRTMKGKILELGNIESSHLSTILRHARLCIIPSLYEGFGLPVLEAQQAEIPLACSTAASLPEVAGKAARFFDPESVEDMAAAIHHCLTDRFLSASLIRAGRENLRRFSWEKTAAETLAVYHDVAGVPLPMAAGVAS